MLFLPLVSHGNREALHVSNSVTFVTDASVCNLNVSPPALLIEPWPGFGVNQKQAAHCVARPKKGEIVDSSTNVNEGRGLSRRSFLKGSAFLAGAATLMGGCSGQPKSDVGAKSIVSSVASNDIEVFDADILVIGCGNGGLGAAFNAYSEGARVMVVDKGPYSFSGGTGYNWDQEILWYTSSRPAEYDPSFANFLDNGVPGNGWLVNQKFAKNVFDFMGTTDEEWDTRLQWVRLGNLTAMRREDGTIYDQFPLEVGFRFVQGFFPRHNQDTLFSLDIPIVDNTMITDVVVSDGVCVGAFGIHVPTGCYRLFRAKATIICTGGATQMYGWNTVRPYTGNTRDNTGDAAVAAYRHGCAIQNSEFFNFDLLSAFPPGICCGSLAGIGADGFHMNYVCDKDGDFFLRDTQSTYDLSRAVAEVIMDGRGGDHGGVFLDLTSPESTTIDNCRQFYSRNIPLWKEEFGIDVTEPGYKIPLIHEAFEHVSSPCVDENGMTEIPGLFSNRGYGETSDFIESVIWVGAYCAKKAKEYIDGLGEVEIDWSGVSEEVARLEEIRTREAEDGLRPHEIRHAIQKAAFECLKPGLRTEENLAAAIAELERIEAEDLPRQICADKSRQFNNEWKSAIENHNIMMQALASVKAADMRKESRGTHFRPDYPDQDDANWLKTINARLVDGKMVMETAEVVGL